MRYSRTSPRHRHYDYTSAWGYFITICTKDRRCYFGNVVVGTDHKSVLDLNNLWKYCEEEIKYIEESRPYVEIHEYVVMPNHIHMILVMSDVTHFTEDGLKNRPYQSSGNNENNGLRNLNYNWPLLWSIIKLFKWNVTKYAKQNNISFARQSRYHDHIIRNSDEYDRIKYYIQTNPENWKKDKLNK